LRHVKLPEQYRDQDHALDKLHTCGEIADHQHGSHQRQHDGVHVHAEQPERVSDREGYSWCDQRLQEGTARPPDNPRDAAVKQPHAEEACGGPAGHDNGDERRQAVPVKKQHQVERHYEDKLDDAARKNQSGAAARDKTASNDIAQHGRWQTEGRNGDGPFHLRVVVRQPGNEDHHRDHDEGTRQTDEQSGAQIISALAAEASELTHHQFGNSEASDRLKYEKPGEYQRILSEEARASHSRHEDVKHDSRGKENERVGYQECELDGSLAENHEFMARPTGWYTRVLSDSSRGVVRIG